LAPLSFVSFFWSELHPGLKQPEKVSMALQSLVNGWSLGTQNTGPNLAGWCKPHAMDDLATLRSTWSVVKSNHSHNPAPGIIVLQKCQAGYCVAKHLLWRERPTSCHPGWAISRFLVSLQRKRPQLSIRASLLPNLPALGKIEDVLIEHMYILRGMSM